MRRSRKQTLLAFAILLAAPLFAAAQSAPELLRPLEQATVDKLLKRTNYGLRGQLYNATRYRLVDINFAALEGRGEFTITPFNDLQMRAVKTETGNAVSRDQVNHWVGRLTYPEGPQLLTDPSGKPVKPADPRPRINLSIRTGDHEVPIELIREIEKESREQGPSLLPDVSGAPANAGSRRVFTKLNLQTVLGRWFVPSLRTNIVIQPIEDDPRYHVIYEEDQSKIAYGPDASIKLERRKKFMEQLERERSNVSDTPEQ
jgi:hypothetical protein